MSQPNRSAAESAAIRSSHSKLVNQVLNAPIGNVPPSSLSTRRPSMTKGSTRCELDSLTFQNLFNHLRLTDLAFDHNNSACCLSWIVYPGSKFPKGTISAILRFESPRNEIAFDAHLYVLEDISIAASGMMDPKGIYLPNQFHFVPQENHPHGT